MTMGSRLSQVAQSPVSINFFFFFLNKPSVKYCKTQEHRWESALHIVIVRMHNYVPTLQ